MESIKPSFAQHINKIYSKESYLDKYGGSALITGGIITAVSAIFGYNYFMINAKSLKKDWKNIRCNPLVMPFAGVINAPPHGSKLEYTAKNFGYCTGEILKDVANTETIGISMAQNVTKDIISGITKSIQEFRNLISSIRDMIGKMFSSILGKIMNVLIPIRIMLIKSLDALNKVGGVGITSLFTALGGVLSINSFLFLFMFGCIAVLVIVGLAIAAEMILGFGVIWIPFAGPFMAAADFAIVVATTVFLIAILVLFIPLISIINDVLFLTRVLPHHRRRIITVQKKTNEYNNKLNNSEEFSNRT